MVDISKYLTQITVLSFLIPLLLSYWKHCNAGKTFYKIQMSTEVSSHLG